MFTTPITLSVGTRYAFQISQALGSNTRLRPGTDQGDNHYAAGEFIRKQAGGWEHLVDWDMAFQILYYPEPATISLLTLGGLMLLRRSRRA